MRYSVIGLHNLPQSVHMTEESAKEMEKRPGQASIARKPWQTALLLVGSAALGGMAVAIWNRKVLADMRNRMAEPAKRNTGREDDIY